MNPGPNLGQQDVSYSGTVSAAIQGTFFLVPSMAVSLIADPDGDFHFRKAARVVRRLAAFLFEHGFRKGSRSTSTSPRRPSRA